MSNSITRSGASTPTGAVASIYPAVWYPGHEAPASTATTRADRLGNGPDLTLSSVVGTSWSANAGWFTFSGTNYWSSPGGNAYLASLARLDNISGQQLIIGYEVQSSGALTGNEAIISWGRNSTNTGASGGWCLGQNSAEQPKFDIRTPSGAAALEQGFASQPRSTTDHFVCVLEIIGRSAAAINLVHSSINLSTGIQAQSSLTIEDLLNGGTAPPNSDANARLLIGVRENSVGVFDRIAASAGSALRENNTWMLRNTSVNSNLAIDCLNDMWVARREFPKSARGL